jgi:tight adherence protein C
MVMLAVVATCLCVAALIVALAPRPSLQVEMGRSVALPATVTVSEASGEDDAARQPPNIGRACLRGLGQLVARLMRQPLERQNRPITPHSSLTVVEFHGLKMTAAAVGALLFVIVAREFSGVDPMFVGLAAAVGFAAPVLWLRRRMQRRHQAILRMLPEVTDLLALCVGAGLDFLGALNKVIAAKAVKISRPEPLIEELAVVLQEIRLGKRRIDALKTMAERVSLPELSSFVRTLVQAEKMGTPIGEALAIHSEDVRLQRFTRAERAALQAPIKILGPLIFCIMPCVAIIVGAPIFLQFMRQSPFGQ